MLPILWAVSSLVAAPDKLVLAVLPLGGPPQHDVLAAAISLKLQETAERIPGLRLMHPKQVSAVAEGRTDLSDPKVALDAGRRLAASHIIYGQLRGSKVTALPLDLYLADKQGKVLATKSVTVEQLDIQAILDKVPALLDELASAVIGKVPPSPQEPARAYMEYAECHRLLTKQSVSLRTPVLLDADNRVLAMKHCQSAVNAAPGLKQAWAALGFSRALMGEKEEAEAALKNAQDDRLIPYYVIAKFWLISRFYDGDQAASYLKESIEKYPGFLLARGYLGEALNALKRYDEALEAFEAFAREVPGQPWLMSQIGYTYAKKKQYVDAIDWTKRGLDAAADDNELRLELASRFIDAGRVAEAQSMLEALARVPEARGEVLLRLGYTHLVQGRLDDAEKWCTLALERAGKSREWRTRGRARYDLAKVAARRGDKTRAVDELEKAFAEGYRDVAKISLDSDFETVRKDPRVVALVAKPKITKVVVPTFASPFNHDPLSGDHPPSDGGPRAPVQKRSLGLSF